MMDCAEAFTCLAGRMTHMSALRTAALTLAIAALALASAAAPPAGPPKGPKPEAPLALLNGKGMGQPLRRVARLPEVGGARVSLRELVAVLVKMADQPGLQITLAAGVERVAPGGADAGVALKAAEEATFAARLPSGTM